MMKLIKLCAGFGRRMTEQAFGTVFVFFIVVGLFFITLGLGPLGSKLFGLSPIRIGAVLVIPLNIMLSLMQANNPPMELFFEKWLGYSIIGMFTLIVLAIFVFYLVEIYRLINRSRRF